jgi:hypothetical protein
VLVLPLLLLEQQHLSASSKPPVFSSSVWRQVLEDDQYEDAYHSVLEALEDW